MESDVVLGKKLLELATKHNVPLHEVNWLATQFQIFVDMENRQPSEEAHAARMRQFCSKASYRGEAVCWFVHMAIKEGLEFYQALDLFLGLCARDIRPDIEVAINLDRRFGRASVDNKRPYRRR
jgi:hypothetical protein